MKQYHWGTLYNALYYLASNIQKQIQAGSICVAPESNAVKANPAESQQKISGVDNWIAA